MCTTTEILKTMKLMSESDSFFVGVLSDYDHMTDEEKSMYMGGLTTLMNDKRAPFHKMPLEMSLNIVFKMRPDQCSFMFI